MIYFKFVMSVKLLISLLFLAATRECQGVDGGVALGETGSQLRDSLLLDNDPQRTQKVFDSFKALEAKSNSASSSVEPFNELEEMKLFKEAEKKAEKKAKKEAKVTVNEALERWVPRVNELLRPVRKLSKSVKTRAERAVPGQTPIEFFEGEPRTEFTSFQAFQAARGAASPGDKKAFRKLKGAAVGRQQFVQQRRYEKALGLTLEALRLKKTQIHNEEVHEYERRLRRNQRLKSRSIRRAIRAKIADVIRDFERNHEKISYHRKESMIDELNQMEAEHDHEFAVLEQLKNAYYSNHSEPPKKPKAPDSI